MWSVPSINLSAINSAPYVYILFSIDGVLPVLTAKFK
jgi:hypothetical protein